MAWWNPSSSSRFGGGFLGENGVKKEIWVGTLLGRCWWSKRNNERNKNNMKAMDSCVLEFPSLIFTQYYRFRITYRIWQQEKAKAKAEEKQYHAKMMGKLLWRRHKQAETAPQIHRHSHTRRKTHTAHAVLCRDKGPCDKFNTISERWHHQTLHTYARAQTNIQKTDRQRGGRKSKTQKFFERYTRPPSSWSWWYLVAGSDHELDERRGNKLVRGVW